jgi:hypothetical protein
MMGRDQTPSRWGTAFPLPEESKAQSRMKDAMSPGRRQFLHSLVFEVRYAPRLCKPRLSIPPTVGLCGQPLIGVKARDLLAQT